MNGNIKNSKFIGVLLLVVISMIVLIVFSFQRATDVQLTGKNTQIKFERAICDLGCLKQGTPKTIQFRFENVGNEPLVIYNVEPSCGCTGAEWSKKPIEQGGEGLVEVTYDAKEPGVFMKTIDVYGNFEDGLVQLTIKGTVER